MKLNEVVVNKEVEKNLKNHELIKENYNSLKHDFESQYVKYFDVDQPLNKEQLENVKGIMFESFCFGAVIAVDKNSCFRRNFNLPKRTVDAIGKKQFEKSLKL